MTLKEVNLLKVTNNVLSLLLVFAIIISVFSTWISLSYIDSFNLLTGKATSGEGTTNLTITSVVSCAINDSLISFGELARGATSESNTVNDTMMLTNDGNTNITIVANVTASSNWLWTNKQSSTAFWAIGCNGNDDSNATCDTAWQNVPGSDSSVTLISKLGPVANEGGTPLDNVTIKFNVTVPSDEPAGYHNGTVTFWCSQT